MFYKNLITFRKNAAGILIWAIFIHNSISLSIRWVVASVYNNSKLLI